jgi:uncharacterized membrane protein YhfC
MGKRGGPVERLSGWSIRRFCWRATSCRNDETEAKMDILYVTYALDGLLMIAMPIALGIYLVRHFDLEGRYWWIGAAVLVLSQIVLLTFNYYLVNPFLKNLSDSAVLPSYAVLVVGALALGLSTGLWEELLRYGMFRWWARTARSWEGGLLVGTGFGGAESILLGLLVLYNFINMAIVRNLDLSTLLPADQLSAAQAQVNAFWSAPWFSTLLDAVRSLFTIPVQICFTIIVLQTFVRKQWYWVGLAVVFHTLFEAATVVAQNLLNPYLIDAAIGVFGVLGVVIIFALRPPAADADVVAPSPAPSPRTYRMRSEPKTVEERIRELKDDKGH